MEFADCCIFGNFCKILPMFRLPAIPVFLASFVFFVTACQAQSTPKQSLLALSKANHTLAIVDPVTFKVIIRIPVGEDPHEVVASADGKTAYVCIYGGGSFYEINVIDLLTQKPLRTIDTRPLFGPHDISFVNGKAWFTAEGSKAVGRYNPATNKMDWSMGTGQDRTHMLHVTSDGKKIYTTNMSSGTVSILDLNLIQPGKSAPPGAKPREEWVQTIVPTAIGSEGFDVTPDGTELWTAASEDGAIYIVNLATKKLAAKIDAKVIGANRLKITPNGKLAFISSLTIVPAEELWTLALYVIGVLVYVGLQGQVAPRMRDLVQIFAKAQDGDFSARYDEGADQMPDPVSMIGRAYNRLRVHLETIVLTDPLSGCFNRRGLNQLAEREVSRAIRGKKHVAVLAIDVDHFKTVNDDYGHLTGDEVIREVGQLLRDTAREIDVVARIGGEEFAILAPDSDDEGALILAERVRHAFRSHRFRSLPPDRRLTTSVGVAAAPARDDEVAKTLLERADEALYVAKRDGRDRSVSWHAGMRAFNDQHAERARRSTPGMIRAIE